MGVILSSKSKGEGKIVFEVMLDYHEAIQLQGRMDNVHLFSDHIVNLNTNISGRGKNEATKYFLIPKELRRNLNIKNNENIRCQKIDTKTKAIFVYIVDKDKI